MIRTEIDRLIATYEKYPEAADYVQTLKNYRDNKPFEAPARPVLLPSQTGERAHNSYGVYTRDDLYQLDEEARSTVIMELAMNHLSHEIKAGHVTSKGRTKEYSEHHIPEINCYFDNKKCPPYDPHGLLAERYSDPSAPIDKRARAAARKLELK